MAETPDTLFSVLDRFVSHEVAQAREVLSQQMTAAQARREQSVAFPGVPIEAPPMEHSPLFRDSAAGEVARNTDAISSASLFVSRNLKQSAEDLRTDFENSTSIFFHTGRLFSPDYGYEGSDIAQVHSGAVTSHGNAMILGFFHTN